MGQNLAEALMAGTALANLPIRARVQAFERQMVASGAPQLKLEVFHHFSPGIYMRELHIPKGVISTGKIHKYPCLNILAKGMRETLVGDHLRLIKAPFIYVSDAGIKRVSYTLEDSIWITVHATTETDIAKLEKDLVCDTEEEYREFCRVIDAGEEPPCPSLR